jgi:hypothetical protein
VEIDGGIHVLLREQGNAVDTYSSAGQAIKAVHARFAGSLGATVPWFDLCGTYILYIRSSESRL